MSLKIETLTHYFDIKSVPAVDQISLDIKKGSIVSIVGPSGSGKSTLLNLINSQLEIQKGEISFDGQEIKAEDVAMVEQIPSIESDQLCMDYLLATADESKGRGENIERIRYFQDMFELENLQRRKLDALSGGQLKRFLTIKALIKGPKVLLLDETFDAIEPALHFEILLRLKQHCQQTGLIIIIVGHQLNEFMAVSDMMGILRYGKALQIGTPSDLYKKPTNAFVAQYFGQCSLLIGNYKDKGYQTDIGLIEIPKENELERALLCFRPETFFVWEKGRFKGKIIEQYYMGPRSIAKVTTDGKNHIFIQLDINHPQDQKKIKFDFHQDQISFLKDVL